jgi:hypothetical protein
VNESISNESFATNLAALASPLAVIGANRPVATAAENLEAGT